MTNKYYTITLIGMLALILVACGNTDADPTETINVEEPTAVSEATESSEAESTAEAMQEEATAEATEEIITTLIAPNPTVVASGETPQDVVIVANVEAADVASGDTLFNQTLVPACVECHIEQGSARLRGPNLINFREIAGARVEGEDAYTYTYNAIRYANRHIVEGYEADVMRTYDGILTDQEVYDLIAYIWTLTDE
ncbi:MAG: c-type cytochrome [Anaerolineae bacterium]